MKTSISFYVFEKWLRAPNHSFGRRGELGVVPATDKDAYWDIFQELQQAAKGARDSHPDADRLFIRPKQYSHERGSRGNRPLDLWVSICAEGAQFLGFIPQVYAIASERGLEIGFAASIPEDDYFDPDVKERNRSLVPFINSKLPSANEGIVLTIAETLTRQGGWHFNKRTRLIPGALGFDAFDSVSSMLTELKREGADTGGGTVCRLYRGEQLASLDLTAAFEVALANFAPLLARCAPSQWDRNVLQSQDEVGDIARSVTFEPADAVEGRRKVIAEIARRQGQSSFRRALIEAYSGQCAVSRTKVIDVLQAAHIIPYNGKRTNHVSNGLLLRADIHTLFDLKLITIDPNSFKVKVSPRLRETPYWRLEGREIRRPLKSADQPNASALAGHFASALGLRTE